MSTKLDANQVLKRAFDDANDRIKVEAEVSATIGTVEVVIDHANDSIKIGDGTDLLAVNTNGSINVVPKDSSGNNLLSQKTMANSLPVVIASDQTETSYISHVENLGSIIYYGFNKNLAATDTDSTWQIYRTSISGADTFKEYASDSDAFSFQWTNRTSYFGAVPFTNTYSTAFDGNNDYVTIPHHSSLNFARTQAFSFAGWFKSQTPTIAGTLATKFTGGFGYQIEHNTSGQISINFQGGGIGNRIRVQEVTATISDGNWHFICITYDGTSAASGMHVYVDNTEAGRNVLNDTLTVDPTSLANLSIAANSTGGTPRFEGFIDEVAFWNVELSAGSRSQIYSNSGNIDLSSNTGTYTQSASLISWWRMGDALSYPSIPDAKGGNHGTLLNAVPGAFVTEIP